MVKQSSIRWRQVIAIALGQMAINLTWVFYNFYLKDLLISLGFAAGLAGTLLIIENGLEIIIEPTFGAWSDRLKRLNGSPLPLIKIGMIGAAIFFCTMPVVVVLSQPDQPLRLLLPIAAVLWASFMGLFRAPMLSLLRDCGNTTDLPKLMALLTLVSSVVGTLKFDVFGLLVKMGPPIAFLVGSASLVLALLVLYWASSSSPVPPMAINLHNPPPQAIPVRTGIMIWLFGMAMAGALRFYSPIVAMALAQQVEPDFKKLALTLFGVILGIVAVPLGRFTSKFNPGQILWLSFGFTIIGLSALHHSSLLLIIAIATLLLWLAVASWFNTFVPFVLSVTHPAHGGLAIGLFFGGFGATMALFDLWVMAALGELAFQTGLGGLITMFTIAGMVIFKLSQGMLPVEAQDE